MTTGPLAASAPLSLYDTVAQDSAAVVIRRYSTSFGLATRLLAEPVRVHVRNIYALVRIADEIVDDPHSPLDEQQRAAVLTALEEETYAAMERGHSANLVVHAFARTASLCHIERSLVEPFFESMRTDLSVRAHDATTLQRYVYGSAEVVGLMCLRAFLVDEGPARHDELAPGAQRLGAAFQKLNFLRDVAADTEHLGRDYFPGMTATSLSTADRDRLLDDIDADLAAAAAVIPALPRSSRRAVSAAHALFAELSRRLRRADLDQPLRQRTRVPNAVKLRLLAEASVGRRR